MNDNTEIIKKLLSIQSELKAPKNQYNKFGKYKYRSCEDIVEAVKPLAKKNGVLLTLSDEIQCIGERYYIKATAILIDIDSGSSFKVTAYAREENSLKGMSEAQITGATSSYARKYALNGLFAIDDSSTGDSPDPDTLPPPQKPKENTKPKEQTSNNAQLQQLYKLAADNGLTLEDITLIAKYKYNLTPIKLDSGQINDMLEAIVRDTDKLKKWVADKKKVNNEG